MSLRQRAYVVLLLTAVLAIVGEWSPDDVARGVWRLPAALLLLGLAYERLETARLRPRLVIDAAARWLLARPVKVIFLLTHASRRERDFELAPAAPEGVELAADVRGLRAAAGAPAHLELEAVPRRLGHPAWPAQRARVAGALGLAWWPMTLEDAAARFRVVPDMLVFGEHHRGLAHEGNRTAVRGGAGSQADQLRDYRDGDPLRIVDWKASARRRELTSRDLVEEQHVDVIIALDAGRSSGVRCGELDRLGHYVNVAARFAEHAAAQEDRIGLVAYADRPLIVLPPARGAAAVRRIRQSLATLETRPVDSNPLPVAARIRSLARRRSLVLLLTDIEDAASTGQLAGAVRLLQPTHLPFVVGIESAALGAWPARVARDWLDPYLSLAAQIGAEQRGRALRALGSLGATALVTRPERLEREVFARYGRFRARRRV
jgi:uncharacterized protein (DUF58 family)